MKNKLIKIISLLTIFTVLIWQSGIISRLANPPTAYAVAGLLIDWGVTPGNPIFTIINMAPGDSQSRDVKVRNGSSDIMPIGIRGIKKSETNNLASALHITISANSTDLYGGTSPTGPKTIQQFLNEAPNPFFVNLTNLAPNQETTYTVKVDFDTNSGNTFQNSNLTLDLRIGPNFDVPLACRSIQFNNEPIYGTEKNDVLKGTDGNDIIFGLKGNDIINAKKGNDCVVGGKGNEVIEGGAGNDVLSGEQGNDILTGNKGNDTLIAGQGNDLLVGSEGIDSCSGGKQQNSCEIKL